MSVALSLALIAASSDWELYGRPLPPREEQAVVLDPALPHYIPCNQRLAGKRQGSVTTILPDLFARWNARFHLANLRIRVASAPPYGPPQGKLSERLTTFLNGQSDFALVSRDLTAADLATYRSAHGGDLLVVPVAAGSWRQFGFVDTVVVIVNAANPLRKISFGQIEAVFSGQGKASTWGDLGVDGWADKPIHPIGGAGWLKEDSARSAVVRQRVLKGGEWRAELAQSRLEEGAPARVANDLYAIAITGLGHLPAGTHALAIAATADGPFIAPDFADVSRNRYPLSRTIDLLLPRHRNDAPDPVMAEFGRFAISQEGQRIVADQGVFLPLTAQQAAASRKLLGSCSAR